MDIVFAVSLLRARDGGADRGHAHDGRGAHDDARVRGNAHVRSVSSRSMLRDDGVRVPYFNSFFVRFSFCKITNFFRLGRVTIAGERGL